MPFQLPSRESKQWTTNGYNSFAGVLDRTFNCDLHFEPGRVRGTRTKRTTLLSDLTDLEPFANGVFGFRYFNFRYYGIADLLNVIKNDGTPEGVFEKDNESGTPLLNIQAADIELYNEALYVSSDEEIHKLDNLWSTPVTGLTDSTATLLERFLDRLYYTDNDLFVGSIDTSDTKATAANTLDLGNFFADGDNNDYHISTLEASNNQLWIGTINSAADDAYIFTWNGQTENTPTAAYRIGSLGVIGMVIQKETNTPIVVTVEGRVMQFNSSGFVEVGRLPIGSEILDGVTASNVLNSRRSMHKNGIIEVDGEILMLVNTKTTTDTYVAPSGIWAYSKETGLYHKYSISQQAKGDDGTTNMIDYGTSYGNTKTFAGALHHAYERTDTSNGRILIGAETYSDRSASNEFGIFIDDTDDNTQKQSFVVSSWLEADAIDDVWTEIVAKHKKFLDSADRIDVKYRFENYDGVTSKATISSNNKISTADSAFATIKNRFDEGVGHDVFVLLGNNAGQTAQIKDIDEASDSYTITLDRNLLVGNGTTRIFTENWKQLESQTNTNKQFVRAPVSDTSTQMQVKIVMTFTGADELNEIFVNNRGNTNVA